MRFGWGQNMFIYHPRLLSLHIPQRPDKTEIHIRKNKQNQMKLNTNCPENN